MKRISMLGASLAALALALPASAAAQEGWFVEGGASGGWLKGDSDTTTGGAAFGGGGTVRNIDVDSGVLYSLAAGRGVAEKFAIGVSYDRLDTEFSYRADYAAIGILPSYFEGEARSDVLLLQARYTTPLGAEGSRWSVGGVFGVGIARNSLEHVEEDFGPPNGVTDKFLEDGESDSFAWKLGGRLSYAFTPRVSLFGELSYFDFGEFETGDTRTAPVEAIGPYGVSISAATLGAGVHIAF